MNNKIENKSLLMMSITILMLIMSPILTSIIPAEATAGDPLLTINNPTPEDHYSFGWSVVSTPDGNILIGSYYGNTGATSAGSVYLFDGATGNLLLTINNPTPEPNDYFGWSVASTPDGNILVGTPYDNTGATSAGSVYLFDGALRGTINIPLLTINNPTPEESDSFGGSVASTPDGNILVGTPYDNTGATSAGSVYLFDGALRGTINIPLLTINNPTPEESDEFGYSVAVTTNGNILVGAYRDNTGAPDAGSAYLFDGTLRGTINIPLLTINNRISGAFDYFGLSVATTIDGNILVGAPNDSTGALQSGSVYLFDETLRGTINIPLLTINNPTPESNDNFGWSVASTPNGNILVGARYDDTNYDDIITYVGSAYLFDGELRGTTNIPLLTINNPTPEDSDRFGWSVASTSDGNILVSAPFDNTDIGSVYLFDENPPPNNPPILDSIPNQSVDEDTSLNLLISATDADSDPISFGITPLLNFTSFIDHSNGTATFLANPGSSDSGVYDFNVTATDGTDTTWQVFMLTVNEINSPPILDPIGNKSTDELVTLQFTATATDVDEDTLSYSLNNSPPTGATIDSLTGEFSWTPTELQDGDHTFDIMVSDGILSDFETITVTVNEINSDILAITIDSNGYVGVGTENPNSRLQISDGYLQLDTISGIPPSEDCDSTDEVGRMKVDNTISTSKLYVCTPAGWMTVG